MSLLYTVQHWAYHFHPPSRVCFLVPTALSTMLHNFNTFTQYPKGLLIILIIFDIVYFYSFAMIRHNPYYYSLNYLYTGGACVDIIDYKH